MRFIAIISLLLAPLVQSEPVPMESVEITEPFLATVHYTPLATPGQARLVIDADWSELGPDTIVALLNQTTDRAAPRSMTTKGRHLTIWLDEAFPDADDLARENDLTVEILSAKGMLGRSPVFTIALK